MAKAIKFLLVWIVVHLPASVVAQPGPSAVVLMYHRFGEDRIPSTNIRLAQFEAHLAYLRDNGFTVVPLPQVVAALQSGAALPDKAVAITVDDAYISVVREAWPRLKRAGYPFTLFVATGAVDRREAGIMSWNDVRALAAEGVTIGGHGHAHEHLPALSADQVTADFAAMRARFQQELGRVPDLYAYPFGEAGEAEFVAARAAGFVAAFGSNSGPVYGEANRYFLPRFAMNENYGRPERFALVTNTRPLRAFDLNPASPVLRDNPPRLSFAVAHPPAGLNGLSCFGPTGATLPVRVDGARVAVTPTAPFPPGRARVNCTLRSGGAWYWFGHEMVAGGISEGVRVHARYRAD
ncbi:MAG: polysaccharide deacetylase family protein [Rhodospirillaceae bacterium]|nr:polysaccharide deacetylase family protein [Rhodospirillaceae bacterium]